MLPLVIAGAVALVLIGFLGRFYSPPISSEDYKSAFVRALELEQPDATPEQLSSAKPRSLHSLIAY